ncbi:MAG TPA: hypothetical protein VH684_26865 [Xanthobacteraceae bacterium]|jgi:hypothetical protein
MSSLKDFDRPAEIVERAGKELAASISDPDRIPDPALQALIASALRLYAVKAEAGMRAPLPSDGGGLTITDTMIAVTDLLHALNVQVFELSMWQAMTGNCIAPHQRIDAAQP